MRSESADGIMRQHPNGHDPTGSRAASRSNSNPATVLEDYQAGFTETRGHNELEERHEELDGWRRVDEGGDVSTRSSANHGVAWHTQSRNLVTCIFVNTRI